MAQVTSVREMRGLICVDLDGMQWIRVRKAHFRKNALEVNDCVDPEEYLDRLAAAQAADCYEAALTMLDSAAQTQAGIVKKLMLKGFVRPAAEAAAQRLVDARLIDDSDYARRLAQSQLGKSAGVYAVRRKLRAKDISEADIEAAMSGFDDAQQLSACREAAAKLCRKYAALPSREARAKLSQALARRGFGWETISAALSDFDGFGDDFE